VPLEVRGVSSLHVQALLKRRRIRVTENEAEACVDQSILDQIGRSALPVRHSSTHEVLVRITVDTVHGASRYQQVAPQPAPELANTTDLAVMEE
jgi:hypothetical protein